MDKWFEFDLDEELRRAEAKEKAKALADQIFEIFLEELPEEEVERLVKELAPRENGEKWRRELALEGAKACRRLGKPIPTHIRSKLTV